MNMALCLMDTADRPRIRFTKDVASGAHERELTHSRHRTYIEPHRLSFDYAVFKFNLAIYTTRVLEKTVYLRIGGVAPAPSAGIVNRRGRRLGKPGNILAAPCPQSDAPSPDCNRLRLRTASSVLC